MRIYKNKGPTMQSFSECLFPLMLVLLGYLGKYTIKADCSDSICQHPNAECINDRCLCSGADYDANTCLPTVSTCNIQTETSHLAKPYIEGHIQPVYSCQAELLPYLDKSLDSIHILSTHHLPTHNTTKELVLTASVTLNFDETFTGDIILALACYEDILWELYVQGNGRRIDRVILLSSDECGVRSVPESAINQVEVLPKRVPHLPFGYGNDTMLGDTPALIRLVEQTYGPVTSFYGSLSADHWIVNINEAPMGPDSISHTPVPANPRNPNGGENVQPPLPATPNPPFPIRLIGGSEPHKGRLEAYHDSTWGSVCDNGWNDLASYVVCNELGYQGAVDFTSLDIRRPGKGDGIGLGKMARPIGQMLLSDVRCDGTEMGLHQCAHRSFGEHTCLYRESVELICAQTMEEAQINIRLTSCGDGKDVDLTYFETNPAAPCHSGVVEVLYHSTWTMVCDATWDEDTANAVCKQLGYKGALGATPGSLEPTSDEGYVTLELLGSSKGEEKIAVAAGMECVNGGARVTCSRAVLGGKSPKKLVETETTGEAADSFDLRLFFILLFLLFIIICILIICIFYMCRSKDKVTSLSQSPHPLLRRVIDRSTLFSVTTKKDDETPILEVPTMASLHTSPAQWNVVPTHKDLAKITDYNDFVTISTLKS